MQSNLRKFLQKLKNPPVWALILNYFCTVVFITAALLMLFVDYAGSALAIVAYASFALAALSLAYTVYTLVRFAPRMKRSVVAWAEKYEFTHSLMRNFGFRTVVLSIGSFALSVAFGAFNGVLGIMSKSIWYGALAGYYILLALLRGGVLLYHKRKHGVDDPAKNTQTQIKTYRNCGILLLVLNIALSVAIAQMIFDDGAFVYAGLMIYASAAYAFYKITMSIINIFRARKQDDLTVQAIRNVNLADATVSILALQTALLNTFSGEGVNISLFNTLTGSVVSLFTLGLGVFMIIKANKERIKNGK